MDTPTNSTTEGEATSTLQQVVSSFAVEAKWLLVLAPLAVHELGIFLLGGHQSPSAKEGIESELPAAT